MAMNRTHYSIGTSSPYIGDLGDPLPNLNPPNAIYSIGNSFPYIGDPLPNLNPPNTTIGTGTITSYPPVNNLQSYLNYNPFGALGDFFNIQYLTVEAVCAVTRRPLKAGEPVLILDEHIISKTAFMKLLREGFERMMVPRVEEMHEATDYDS